MRLHSSTLFVLFAALSLAAGTAHAQTTAVGPYLATPAWDQKLPCETMATCPRFVVLSNWNSEAVLDRETGLVWERSPDTQMWLWYSSIGLCRTKSIGGRFGWRLPDFQELASLATPNADGTVGLPPGHPFENVVYHRFWSSTSVASLDANARGVDFVEGTFFNASKTLVFSRHWCVRGGQGIDGQ